MKTKFSFALLFIILLTDYFCYGLIVPVITEKLNMHTGQNAVLGSGLVIMLSPTYLVALPILCAVSNLWGRKKTFALCLGLSVASYLIFWTGAYVGSAFIVLLSVNLADITTAELPIAQAIAADTPNPWLRSYLFALLALADLIDIVSTQLHDYIHQLTNYQWFNPMLIAAIVVPISLINFLLAARFLRSSAPVVVEKDRDVLTEIIESFSHILSNKSLRTVLIFFALFSMAWGLYFQNLFFYLTDGAVIHPESASLFIIYTCLTMFITLSVVFPILIRLITFEKLLLSCLLVSALGLAMITFMTTKESRWATGMMIAISTPMIIPIAWTILTRKLERRYQIMAFGIAYLILTLFWELSGAIVKILNMLNSSLALQLAALLLLCSIPLAKKASKA